MSPFFLPSFSSLLPIFPLPYAIGCLISLLALLLVTDSFVPHFFFQDEPEPISVYHPIAKELSASIGTPMEGFFDGADVVFEAATPAPLAAAQEVLAEAFIPSTEPVPIGEGTHTEGISETAPIPVETLTS